MAPRLVYEPPWVQLEPTLAACGPCWLTYRLLLGRELKDKGRIVGLVLYIYSASIDECRHTIAGGTIALMNVPVAVHLWLDPALNLPQQVKASSMLS